MSDATQAVTAALTAQLLGEAAANGDPGAAEVLQREAAAAQPVVAQPVAVSAPAAPAPPAPAAEAPVVEAPEVPVVPEVDFKPKLSDELQALLDEPDFEEEAALEVAAEMESEDYDGEYVDPAVAAKLKALEKRNAFLEQRVVEAGRKKWVAENLDAYPLLKQHFADEVRGIQATSRRGFAREAAKLNEKYERALGPVLTALEDAKKAIASGAVETARKEVAAAWGSPASDSLPPIAVAKQEALEAARKKGDLQGSIKVLMDEHPVM